MRAMDRFSLSAVPLLLRLGLAVTFLWAGTGKIFSHTDYTPEQSAQLARMGVINVAPLAPETDPAGPEEPLPEPGENGDEVETPETDPADAPDPEAEQPADDSEAGEPALRSLSGRPAGRRDRPVATPVQATTGQPTAADFPEGTRLRQVYGLALLNCSAATTTDTQKAVAPSFFATYAVELAWLAAVTEFLGGACLLLGFLTRIFALGIAAVMIGALWLTQIGPVIVGNVAGTWGFLPALNDFGPEGWDAWLWQFMLGLSALAVVLSGPGALSLDRLIFGRRAPKGEKREADDE